ncbi:Cuticle-degrading protease-like protein, partial [Leptotrombidium deliense]
MVQLRKSFVKPLILIFALICKIKCDENEINVSGCDAPVVPAEEGRGIEGQYIIQFKDNVTENEANEIAMSLERAGGARKYQYRKRRDNETGFSGIAVKVNSTTRDNVLREATKNCKVKRIEQDQLANTYQCTSQSNAGWCLSRVSRTSGSYNYDSNSGSGSKIYVIGKHQSLYGRVTSIINFVADEDGEDNNGHGTKTASVAAGNEYGTSKKAEIICVKAMNRNGQGAY